MAGNGENITYNLIDEFWRASTKKRNVFDVWRIQWFGYLQKLTSLLHNNLQTRCFHGKCEQKMA